jgi:ABC-type lipoprotein export system ATPase subunit
MVLELLVRTARKLRVGIVMATHSVESTARVNRVIRMRDGRIQE